MMSLNHFYKIWLCEFQTADIADEIAQEEFNNWAETLDGETNNEYTQNDLSVADAAQEAIKELVVY